MGASSPGPTGCGCGRRTGDGKWFEAEAEGLTAWAFCHEIEHLDGHLFVEHIDHFLTDEELKEYLEDEE